jgi:hypothetical protein
VSTSVQSKEEYTNWDVFAGSRLGVNEILLLGKLWVDKASVTSAISLNGHSSAIVVEFYAHFRKLLSSTLDEEDVVIGGCGIVIEMDETKMGCGNTIVAIE